MGVTEDEVEKYWSHNNDALMTESGDWDEIGTACLEWWNRSMLTQEQYLCWKDMWGMAIAYFLAHVTASLVG